MLFCQSQSTAKEPSLIKSVVEAPGNWQGLHHPTSSAQSWSDRNNAKSKRFLQLYMALWIWATSVAWTLVPVVIDGATFREAAISGLPHSCVSFLSTCEVQPLHTFVTEKMLQKEDLLSTNAERECPPCGFSLCGADSSIVRTWGDVIWSLTFNLFIKCSIIITSSKHFYQTGPIIIFQSPGTMP